MGDLRIWDTNGDKYVARDIIIPGRSPQPQHAVWEDGKVLWINHREGGVCSPYTGPMSKIQGSRKSTC